MDILDFLHGIVHQEKVASETTIFGWVYPGMPNHDQNCLDLPRVLLGSLEGIARLKVIQNERLINSWVN